MVDHLDFFVGMDVWIDFHPGRRLLMKVKAVRQDYAILRTAAGNWIYVEYDKLTFITMCAMYAHYEYSTMNTAS